ncbi:MAG TPA: lamin tail domain-containing protein [Bacteroidota bacterium]|nr:lamin tail domain-containing protein [Bacteroidota bacterium]
MHNTIFLFLFLLTGTAVGQIQYFPYRENFDTVSVPALPAGWITTSNRSVSGDFVTSHSIPHSDSGVVLSTSAAITQSLVSPLLDFSGREVDSLSFYERRSSSHNSGVLIEASTDGGATFQVPLSDTLVNPGVTSYIQRRLKLPDLLGNQSSVRIRWRILGNGTGTSGTLRFDDVAISARAHLDVSVDRASFIPAFPRAGDSVIVLATIRNAGTLPGNAIRVDFFEDLNLDTLPEEKELFGSASLEFALAPNDTALLRSVLRNLAYGLHNIIVVARLAADENPLNDVARERLSVGLPQNSIVINEIDYAPPAGKPEWIELYNATASEIGLDGWALSNRITSSRYTLSHTAAPLPAAGYIVITKDTALFREANPATAAAIIQVSSLPTFLLNNQGDAVVLFGPEGAVMDTVRFFPSWGGSKGSSLERIEARGNSNDSVNWGSSGDSSGSTPGSQNYLTPLDYDLRVVRIRADDSLSISPVIAVVIRNVGRMEAGSFDVSIYDDMNSDSTPQQAERIAYSRINRILMPADSIAVSFVWETPPPGMHHMIGTVGFPPDMRVSDNIAYGLLRLPYPNDAMIINEIMYEPLSGNSEYVELLNRSGRPVDLRDWELSSVPRTSARTNAHPLTRFPLIIGAGEFAVIGSDSSLLKQFPYLVDPSSHVIVRQSGFSLNNSGERVILQDLTGRTIDSVFYLPAWHNAEIDDHSGRSLERINPNISGNDARNWSTSANPLGGTPGRRNSLYTAPAGAGAAISFSPNPFSPDGDSSGAFLPNHPTGSKTCGFTLSQDVDDTWRLYQEKTAGP